MCLLSRPARWTWITADCKQPPGLTLQSVIDFSQEKRYSNRETTSLASTGRNSGIQICYEMWVCTVEPLNKGHFGLIVLSLLEGPLSEVSLLVVTGSDELWCHLARSILSRCRSCDHYSQKLVRN